MKPRFDVLIVGGGVVGMSLARALSSLPVQVGLIEARDPDLQPARDERLLALSWASRRILDGLGAWEGLGAARCPIEKIQVSDRGYFGKVRLDCREEGVDALGYTCPGDRIQASLQAVLQQCNNVALIRPAVVTNVRHSDQSVSVDLDGAADADSVAARLLVAADGSRSTVRTLLDIPVDTHRYGQHAVIANIGLGRRHGNTAYERFTEAGPVAMLPAGQRQCVSVWTMDDDQVDVIAGLDNRAFLSRLQALFGLRLGRLESVGRTASYPLERIQAQRLVQDRVVLIGNAAQTLHPIAGQGLNLGLRDVAALAETISDVVQQGGDPGNADTLQHYANWRRRDRRVIGGFTHGLLGVFGLRSSPAGILRSAGLVVTDLLPPVRHALCRQTMGIAGRQPRLVRGLPLH